jgi:hypothetical protein
MANLYSYNQFGKILSTQAVKVSHKSHKSLNSTSTASTTARTNVSIDLAFAVMIKRVFSTYIGRLQRQPDVL